MAMSIVPITEPKDLGNVMRNVYIGMRQGKFPPTTDIPWDSVEEHLKQKYIEGAEYFFHLLGVDAIHKQKALALMTPVRLTRNLKTGQLEEAYDPGTASALYRWLTKSRHTLTNAQAAKVEEVIALLESLEADLPALESVA